MPINDKLEVFGFFLRFLRVADRQTGRMIESINSDDSEEYMSNELLNSLKDLGVVVSKGSYTPQQSELDERMNCALLEMARAMVQVKNVSN